MPGVEVEFNEAFGRALETALEQARTRGLVSGTLTPGDLLRLPQALTIRERQTDADEGTLAAVAVAGARCRRRGARSLDVMRTTEGDHLRADLDQRRTFVADLVERVAVAADEGRVAMEERLAERVRQIRVELQADESRRGPGDREGRVAVGHFRRGRAVSRARLPLGHARGQPRTVRDGSWTSCCRR